MASRAADTDEVLRSSVLQCVACLHSLRCWPLFSNDEGVHMRFDAGDLDNSLLDDKEKMMMEVDRVMLRRTSPERHTDAVVLFRR